MAIAASTGLLASLNSFVSNDAVVKAPVQQTSPIAQLQKQNDANLQAANEQKNNLPTGTPNPNSPRGSYVNFVV